MNLFYLIRTVLREIFDEAAYQRFCAEHRLMEGQSSYFKFIRNTGSDRKVRCC